MKNSIKIGFIIILLFIPDFFNLANEKEKYKIRTVVIDAGHGGHDSGCLGAPSNSKEKNVTLAVALKLGALITKNFPDIKVIYTRKTDVFIELHERAGIANRNNADLFISIHCNANANTAAFGAETYLMGLHKTDANLDVSKRENAVITLEKDYKNQYDGFDPNAPETHIILSLNQNAHIEQSTLLAGFIQKQFKELGRYSRGVKQAGFLVLYKTAMPAVLIETGFLTNPSEGSYLISDEGQSKLSSSIFKGFKSYKDVMEGNSSEIAEIPKEAPTPPKEEPKEKPKEDPKPIVSDPEKMEGIKFKVQIFATKGTINTETGKFSKVEKLHKEMLGDVKRFLCGPFSTFKEAYNYRKKIIPLGFTDAYVVVYKDGVRLSGSEANAYLK